MFIRYFARTDDSDLGGTAASYCDALVATGIPVRLVSTRVAELQVDYCGRSSSLWDRHRGLLVTPMDGAYTNVVCGDVSDWERFHTAGVENAILFTDKNLRHLGGEPFLEGVIALYGLAFVPSAELANVVERVTGYRPIVVPLGTPDAAAAFLRLKPR